MIKGNDEEIRAHFGLVKAQFKKKAHLEQDISKLKIRQNFKRFNPSKKTLKELIPYRKSLVTLFNQTRSEKRLLNSHKGKGHSTLNPEIFEKTLEAWQNAETATESLKDEISQKSSKSSLLQEKLQNLRKVLQEKRKIFELNKEKIEKLNIVADLCHGRQNSLDLFSTSKDPKSLRNKGMSRIDSISTTESIRHIKQISYNPLDFSGSELENEESLNKSMVTFERKKQSKKLKRFQMLLMLPQKKLFLRSKLVLKKELENSVLSNERKLFKKFSKTQKVCIRLKNVLFALENDPEGFLKQLKQEEVLRESELNAEKCKKEYYESIVNKEGVQTDLGSFVLESCEGY